MPLARDRSDPTTSRALTVEDRGVPGSGVSAIVLNVTAIAPSLKTFLLVYPAGGSRPGTSNVNPNVTRPSPTSSRLRSVPVVSIELYKTRERSTSRWTSKATSIAHPQGVRLQRGCSVPNLRHARSGWRRSGKPVQHRRALADRAGRHADIQRPYRHRGVPATGVTAVVFNLTAINPSSIRPC